VRAAARGGGIVAEGVAGDVHLREDAGVEVGVAVGDEGAEARGAAGAQVGAEVDEGEAVEVALEVGEAVVAEPRLDQRGIGGLPVRLPSGRSSLVLTIA
jgi:hypothetical protein